MAYRKENMYKKNTKRNDKVMQEITKEWNEEIDHLKRRYATQGYVPPEKRERI